MMSGVLNHRMQGMQYNKLEDKLNAKSRGGTAVSTVSVPAVSAVSVSAIHSHWSIKMRPTRKGAPTVEVMQPTWSSLTLHGCSNKHMKYISPYVCLFVCFINYMASALQIYRTLAQLCCCYHSQQCVQDWSCIHIKNRAWSPPSLHHVFYINFYIN